MIHRNKGVGSRKSGKRGVRPAVWWGLVGIAVLFSALMHYGYFLAGGQIGGESNARGKVVACSPQWVYVGLLSTCDIRTPGRDAPVVEADDRVEGNIITTTGPRLGGAEVGDSVLLTYNEGALAPNSDDNPRDPSDDYEEAPSHWEVARSAPSYAAEVPVQMLLVGLGIFFCVRSALAFRRRFDAPAPKPVPISEVDKFLIGVLLVLSVVPLVGAYLIGEFLMPSLESGSIGSVLSGILMFALGLVGVGGLLGTALEWSSERSGDSFGAKKES